MHLALVCFFFEADAKAIGLKAGKEASKIYLESCGLFFCERQPRCMEERLEALLLRISKLVDPMQINRFVNRYESYVYGKHFYQAGKRRRDEAKFFSERFLVLNVLAFYGCLKYLLASIC